MSFLTTPRGLRYPDRFHPADISAIVKALADDTDAQLTSVAGSVQSYAPTLTGVSAQAGTMTAEFVLVAGMVIGRVAFKVSAAPTGEVKIGFPYATRSLMVGIHTFGVAICRDDSSGIYISGELAQVVDVAGPITASNIYTPASGTNTNMTKVASGTAPIPWAAGDQITAQFAYAKG